MSRSLDGLFKGVTGVVLVGLFVLVLPLSAFPNGAGVEGAVSDGVVDKILTFLHTAAEAIGRGLVRLIDLIAGVDVSELSEPLGYLGILTVSLIVFGALKAAQKVVWFVVSLGWGLIIIRIILEVLDKSPAR
ncbi:MAG: hypothetical protein ACLFTO_04470 [Candidatus Acetothermia bacterium]